VLDRVGAVTQREVDAVRAMRVHGDFLSVQVRGLDQRLGFVVQHLPAQACADAAVHAARRHDLDVVDAAADLQAHRATAGLGAVAQVLLMCVFRKFGTQT
jgi:hypothetical protein